MEIGHNGDVAVLRKTTNELFRCFVPDRHVVNHNHTSIRSQAPVARHVGVDDVAISTRICDRLSEQTFVI